MPQEKKHIVLAGDSIFDNGSYVPGQPDVAQQLRNQLGEESNVTLLAIDGDITRGVQDQLKQLPEETSHLFISVGGNDALGQMHMFTDPISSVGEGFLKFSRVQTNFQEDYKAMLENALSLSIPTTICTIYKPCFYHPDMSRVGTYIGNGVSNEDLQNVSVTALTAFNDVILQEAVNNGIPLIDLRVMYNNVADYANPIEPSTIGGQKMVSVMESIINGHPFGENLAVLYSN